MTRCCGLVSRHLLDTSPPSAEYTLTELGREVMPAIKALIAVGHKLPEVDGRARNNVRKAVTTASPQARIAA